MSDTSEKFARIKDRVYRISVALVLRSLIALLITLLVYQINLDMFEPKLYDFGLRLRHSLGLDKDKSSKIIELVYIDKKTVEFFRKQPDFKEHGEFLEKLAAMNPSHVVYFTAPPPIAEPDFAMIAKREQMEVRDLSRVNPEHQSRFLKATELFKNLYFAADYTSLKVEENQLVLPPPFDKLKIMSGPYTADYRVGAKDGVTRRAALTQGSQLLLLPKIAADINPDIKNLNNIRGKFELTDSEQIYVDFLPMGAFSTTSFLDVYLGKVNPAQFKNKVVLIGTDLNLARREKITSPFSKKPFDMPQLEVQASTLETLVKNSAPIFASRSFNFFVTFLLCFLTVHAILVLPTAMVIAVFAGSIALYASMAMFAFLSSSIIVGWAHPLAAAFLTFGFLLLPYRLIIESRKSWEFAQKNKFLMQVEELKNNFIGMMSHDLKTPIARIQGMADLVLRKNDQLGDEEKRALNNIKQSSEELLSFISTILNFTNMESQGVKLQLMSRDINPLIEKVISRHEFLASLKNIELKSELEPLFSIPIDENLIGQVLSNLVENAVKYSGQGSKVLITTEEQNGYVVIQVADQGMGIPSEDFEVIFQKFARSKDAKASPVKGSGLGLYLAKYFVEMHGGQISVESEVGKGSTFTVRLPITG